MRIGLFLLAAAAALAIGCNGNGDTTPAAGTPQPGGGGGAQPTATPAGGGGTGGTQPAASVIDVHLTLTGGPDAGQYDGTHPTTGCSYGLTGEDQFGIQFSTDDEGDKDFTSLQLIVESTEDAAEGTDEFLTTITIGPLFGASSRKYEIRGLSGREPSGSGTVTIDNRGDTATLTIVGETEEGVGIEAEVTCHSIFRSGR